MSMFICVACGTQYADSPVPPARCDVCRNETSLESSGGQPWTTLEQIRVRHTNVVQRLERDLFSVRSIPTFLAGQRALLLRTGRGNILWDCITPIDEATVRTIRVLGGVTAVAMSHPRLFASVVEWSHAFGGVPVYLHATSRRWLMRPDPVVQYWDGAALTLLESATLVHLSAGPEGGTVLHWPAAAAGEGALLTGDVVQVLPHRKRVGLLSSSRDFIPRSAEGVRRLLSAIEPLSYEALYDAWSYQGIMRGAHGIVHDSAECYMAALRGSGHVADPRCSRIA
jgi:hypothetical protein